MCEGAGVDEELDAEDEDLALLEGRLDAFDGVVVGCEDQDAEDDVVGDFDDDLSSHECDPGVGFGRAFADFVEVALSDEEWHDLDEV